MIFIIQLLMPKKVSEREESEPRNFLEGLWLFMPLVKTRPMGRPWDNGKPLVCGAYPIAVL